MVFYNHKMEEILIGIWIDDWCMNDPDDANGGDESPPSVEKTGEDIDWPDDWDERDRVEAIAACISHPRDAEWISRESGVEIEETRRYLREMQREGEIVMTKSGEEALYLTESLLVDLLYKIAPEKVVLEDGG